MERLKSEGTVTSNQIHFKIGEQTKIVHTNKQI